jgi:hypothetical protein
LDSQANSRSIYTLLNWIGDIGGFAGVILLIGKFLYAYFSSNQLINFLFNSIFKRPAKVNLKTIIAGQLISFCKNGKSKTLRLRRKAVQRIEKELDIVYFIRS